MTDINSKIEDIINTPETKIREPLPGFRGQYSDEKVLFYAKENIIYFIFQKLYIFLSILLFSIIISTIVYFFVSKIYGIITLIIFILLIIFYYYLIYRDTNLIFTTRRIIKKVRTGLFSKHKKELKILDIKSSTANKKGLLQAILQIGNIKIEGTETDSAIFFRGIKEHNQLSNYIGRVIDYIKLNGHTDNIARYQDKNYRKKLKQKSK